ncbi:hypothetical protein ACQKE9_00750 [Shewanella vesiculosa]|uniref:hypothetical protein n=1 Tax=Shewanella vesiculosa TaxID=518738 RepID=UPI003CFEF6B0
MKVAINFADENFKGKQKFNTKTALNFGGFDKVYEFGPSDIDDLFYESNKNILEQKRGGGYWLWKPYFIKKVLEKQNIGDYVFYSDSGTFFINKIKYLIDVMDRNDTDIMLFELPLIECEWTNSYLFKSLDLMSEKYRLSNQICATYILLRNSVKSRLFINEYLELCMNENYITDVNTITDGIVKDHRHDQSILSLLAKSKKMIPFRDPSDYGIFPFRYFTENRLFKVNSYKDEYPVILLSNRKADPHIYWLKFMIRKIFGR